MLYGADVRQTTMDNFVSVSKIVFPVVNIKRKEQKMIQSSILKFVQRKKKWWNCESIFVLFIFWINVIESTKNVLNFFRLDCSIWNHQQSIEYVSSVLLSAIARDCVVEEDQPTSAEKNLQYSESSRRICILFFVNYLYLQVSDLYVGFAGGIFGL